MMRKVAAEYGVNLYAVKTNLKTLKKGDVVLLNISGNTHFVTIQSIGKDFVIFIDPVLGPIKIPRKEFDKWYTGYTLSTDKKGKIISENKQKELNGGIAVVVIGVVAVIVILIVVLAASSESGSNNDYKKDEKNFMDGINKAWGGVQNTFITAYQLFSYLSNEKDFSKYGNLGHLIPIGGEYFNRKSAPGGEDPLSNWKKLGDAIGRACYKTSKFKYFCALVGISGTILGSVAATLNLKPKPRYTPIGVPSNRDTILKPYTSNPSLYIQQYGTIANKNTGTYVLRVNIKK